MNNFKLNVLCVNLRSLRCKLTTLSQFLETANPLYDIVILCETWLNQSEVKFFGIPNYHAFHSTREKIGGGVAVYTHESLGCANELLCNEHLHCNYLAVEVHSIKTKILTAYRPPSADLSQFLENIDEFLEKNDKVLFFGDTNVDIFQKSSLSTKLLMTFENNGMLLVNDIKPNFFTRKDPSRKTVTLIDQVFTNAFDKS